MIKYLAILLFLSCHLAAAAVRVDLAFQNTDIKQGAIEEAKVILGSEAVQRLQLQKIKGQTLGGTLYVYDVSPLVRKEGGSSYEADAKVIFVKVPESQNVSFKEGGEDIVLTWNNLSVSPTEAQGMIYEKFSIPSRPKIMLWLSCLIALVLLILGGLFVYRKTVAKKALKLRKLTLKHELESGKDYQEIVTIWMKRENYLKTFPHIEKPFRELEGILFKYQFKPTQSEGEKTIVVEAYRKFLSEISGGFNGI